MNTLELFAGSRSFSKVAEKFGHETFTTDIEPFEKIDVVGDFFDFDVDPGDSGGHPTGSWSFKVLISVFFYNFIF